VEWGEDSSEVVGGSGAGGECEGKIRIRINMNWDLGYEKWDKGRR